MTYINVLDEDLKEHLLKQNYKLLSTYKANNETVWVFEDTSNRFVFDINFDMKNKYFISDKLKLTF